MNTPRLIKIGDALSQPLNVAVFPNHRKTTANESISGRAHRMSRQRTERAIDWLLSPFEEDHCRKAHGADVHRAKVLAKCETNIDM